MSYDAGIVPLAWYSFRAQFKFLFLFFFFNDTATTEIYTLHIVGSVRCVQETGINAEYMGDALRQGQKNIDVDKINAQLANERWWDQKMAAVVAWGRNTITTAWTAVQTALDKAAADLERNEKYLQLRAAAQSALLKATGKPGQAAVVDYWESRRMAMGAALDTGNTNLIEYAKQVQDAERAALPQKIVADQTSLLSKAQSEYNDKLQATKALTEQGLITGLDAQSRMRQATIDLGKSIEKIAEDNAGLLRDGILSPEDLKVLQERMALIRADAEESAYQQQHGFESTAKAVRTAADQMHQSMQSSMSDMLHDVIPCTLR
eukprot:TRINITY_DN23293_c0_g1_i1.p1 TRINITY_DN23293_c0_g1~~TRINITY_DN23293_c0_g1_i1.p1  ORF type:complete len:320 (+),score=42.81 TRINITY_DN23293_c0_g1_i1:35-994(+)